MKRLGLFVGGLAGWLLWPVLFIYLRVGTRTRALIICGDEFLVLRGWLGNDNWGLPGGGLHRGEDAEVGVRREIREETGIIILKNQLKFAYHAGQKHNGLKFSYGLFVVKLAAKPRIKLQTYEIADYAWQSIHKPTVKLSPDATRAVLWHVQNKG